MNPRILILDTYYPDFLKSLPFDPTSTYEVELRKVLDRCFGTCDAYSLNLRALGWNAIDVIANHVPLQEMWARKFNAGAYIVASQIERHKPDVIFMQDLSSEHPRDLEWMSEEYILAGQLSCPWPGDETVREFDVLFTSFPHYIHRIEALGVRAVYNPLAFEPSVLQRINTLTPGKYSERIYADIQSNTRIHDVVFIGGVGNPSHWRYGMEVLETVAREIPTFKWWGYGLSTLPADSALRRCYQGEAWGLDMYEILLQSKIVLNRHGEVAEGYANNMRMFEATGCGALLLTERAPNLTDFFSEGECLSYDSWEEAAWWIDQCVNKQQGRMRRIAAAGQKRTLRDHTYAQRMKVVSSTLMEMLCPA